MLRRHVGRNFARCPLLTYPEPIPEDTDTINIGYLTGRDIYLQMSQCRTVEVCFHD